MRCRLRTNYFCGDSDSSILVDHIILRLNIYEKGLLEMKRFKAVIKAKTDTGMSLNYECTNPKGLLVEAINFALITGIPVEEIKRMVNSQSAALSD